jgi:hypothetical protein
MTELFIIYVGAKNDLALGEWTSPLEGATRATLEAKITSKITRLPPPENTFRAEIRKATR